MRFILLFAILLNCLACSQKVIGSGKLATRQLGLSNVRKISIAGVGKLSITQGQEENLLIEADDNILPHILSEVKNGELVLKPDKNLDFTPVIPLIFSVKIKDISKITASGSTEIEINSLKTTNLNVNLKGSTKMGAKITLNTLSIDASGSSQVTLNGVADSQIFVLKGSSKIDGSNLIGKQANLNASGSAHVKLNVTEKISGSASGSVTVHYKNNPTNELKASGSVTIQHH